MLKRELVHPETQVKVSLTLADKYVQVINPTLDNGPNVAPFDYMSVGLADPEEFFHEHVKRFLAQGYQETEASKSRRVLQVREGDQPTKYWIIELDDELCELQYGKFPKYGHWIGGGSKKDIDCETREKALETYIQQILKKLKEGYTEYYRRENEYTALTDAALAAPVKAPAKDKVAKAPPPVETDPSPTSSASGAGRRRYELSEGSSNKFWEIELSGNIHTVTFGRIGTSGQSQTKEFASEAEARKSFDKLIAEKTKKGYQLVSSAAAEEVSLAPAPKPAAKKPPAPKLTESAEQTQTPGPVAAAARSGSTAVREGLREIELKPWEVAAVRYRKPAALSRGEPRPFDLKECCQLLGSVPTEQYGWLWRWDLLELPIAMSREEAHFWLTAILDNPTRQTPKQVAKEFRKRDFDGRMSFETIATRLANRTRHGVDPVIMLPMAAILDLEEIVSLLRREPDLSKLPAHQVHYDCRADLSDGFATYVVPFVAETDLEALRSAVRQGWNPTLTPASFYHPFDGSYYLAAALGMHEEVHDVVSRIEDEHYLPKTGVGDWCDHYQRPQLLVLGLGSAEDVANEMRRLKLKLRFPRWMRRYLAATQFSGLDVIHDTIVAETNKDQAATLLEAFTIVHAPEAAEPMLDLKLNSKAPAIARDWLNNYVGCAVTGLLETVGGRGKLADVAVQYLREAKALGHGDLIENAVAALPDSDAKTKVLRAVVQYEEKVYTPLDDQTTPDWFKQAELDTIATPKSKLPSWALPAVLPPIVVGERKLNDAQVETIIKLMMKSTLSAAPPLLKAVRQHASRTSLDAFAWKLFESWLEDGASSKEKWALMSIGFLGGDHCVLKLTPLLRIWPGESQHQRAVTGLECLRAVGSDTALMQLNGIANKLKFQGLKNKAREFMGQIATEKGLTPAELEDRIVPDLDLDARGSREFDFGPRKFKFVLGADLKPMIRDEDGKLKKDLPKPGKSDDAVLANESLAQWKLLKKQLTEAIKVQVPRLEQAMVTGRRWTVEQFESFIVKHPLMVNFARTLLWGGYDGSGNLVSTFRVTEEQDFANVDDDACSLAGVDRVGLVHPAHLDPQLAAKWGEVFSDYEIAPCFQQLGRKVFRLETEEESQKELTRFNHVKINPMTLVGMLDRMGWARGIPEDAGIFHEHSKPFYGANVTAFLQYEEGIPIGYMDGWNDQRLTGCFFTKGIYTPKIYPKHEDILPLGKVDAVVLSEVLRDLFAIESKGNQ